MSVKLRPLRDQIILRPLSWRPSAIIEVAGDKRRTLRGVVVAVGPGERVKKYWKDSRGQRCKMGETGQVIPTEVRPGDVVEIGGLELDGYRFQTVTIEGQQYCIIQQQDVAFVIEEPSEADADAEVAARYRCKPDAMPAGFEVGPARWEIWQPEPRGSRSKI